MQINNDRFRIYTDYIVYYYLYILSVINYNYLLMTY